MRLKRWESPRRQGRNDKGRGGSARKRQLKKQTQMLRQKLKEGNNTNDSTSKNKHQSRQGEGKASSPCFLCLHFFASPTHQRFYASSFAINLFSHRGAI